MGGSGRWVTVGVIGIAMGLGTGVRAEAQEGPRMFRGGPTHPGEVAAPGVSDLGGVAWRFKTDGPVRSSPTLASGVLYVGSSDGHLYALDAGDGAERWRFDARSPIAGAPLVAGDLVVAITRSNAIIAVDRTSGRQRWVVQGGETLPLAWGGEGWDYILASPILADGRILAGTGDGVLRALTPQDGRELWSARTGGRIRSAPAVSEGMVYIGSGSGWLHAFDLADGTECWTFETEGVHWDAAEAGFDRTQIYSSPTIVDGVLHFGSRDAADYALDARTGELLWSFREGSAWVITTPAVVDGRVYTGRSSGGWMYSLDAATGEKVWEVQTGGLVFSSPTVADDVVYFGSGDRFFYALDAATGERRWRYATGGAVMSSPTVWDDNVYFGSDDGFVYALRAAEGPAPRLAVYWDESLRATAVFGSGATHDRPATWFERIGYETLDGEGLGRFLEARIADGVPSVVVAAMDALPAALMSEPLEESPLRRYLEAGGKVVWMGFPAGIVVRGEDGAFAGIDRDLPMRLLGVDHGGWDTDEYGATVTELGREWGFDEGWVGYPGLGADADVEVLAVDEVGRPAAWVRNYGGPRGTGFVFVPSFTEVDWLRQLRLIAEYGVFRQPSRE